MAEPAPSFLPSGAQHEIRHRDQHAVVVEVGGGLRTYADGAGDLLDGYSAQESCGGARGQPLIPWPNRLRDGRYEFEGQRYQLPLTEPETRTAIHGLVRWATWSVRGRDQASITMEHVLRPQPGWPGTLLIQIAYSLDDAGLTVATTATNVGPEACPYGAGAHPYLTLGTDTIDTLTVTVPGRRYLEADERGIPTGITDTAGTEFDFLAPRELGGTHLDTAYGDLVRDADGLARVRIAAPDGARAATLWFDRAHPYVMVFTGDTLPAQVRRRGLAIEPMTCPPNSFQSGAGLRRLGPGESFTARWGISPT